ncbi:MAG: 50S ribosomal protein L11 methyltransferase [Bacteroidia bacterium]|nr:50S ribosomal protein L11 methyltransferase [Bacteroidia bacterium]
MNHYKYIFNIEPKESAAEILTAYLEDFPFYAVENDGQKVTAYITEIDDRNFDPEQLIESFIDLKIEWNKELIPYKNWNEAWEKNYAPVVIDDEILIYAPFHRIEKKYPMQILIRPQMSFGTGHHPTTRLMLKAMKNSLLNHQTVLDFGCGSGVLAIAASLWGAKNVWATDIDTVCINNTKENLALNPPAKAHVVPTEQFIKYTENHPMVFDVVLANINKNVIRSHLGWFNKITREGSTFFFSGFYEHDADELTIVLQNELQAETKNIYNEDSWACIVCHREK